MEKGYMRTYGAFLRELVRKRTFFMMLISFFSTLILKIFVDFLQINTFYKCTPCMVRHAKIWKP